jgi:hypothetical protein
VSVHPSRPETIILEATTSLSPAVDAERKKKEEVRPRVRQPAPPIPPEVLDRIRSASATNIAKLSANPGQTLFKAPFQVGVLRGFPIRRPLASSSPSNVGETRDDGNAEPSARSLAASSNESLGNNSNVADGDDIVRHQATQTQTSEFTLSYVNDSSGSGVSGDVDQGPKERRGNERLSGMFDIASDYGVDTEPFSEFLHEDLGS